jgi:hypothetical protein
MFLCLSIHPSVYPSTNLSIPEIKSHIHHHFTTKYQSDSTASSSRARIWWRHSLRSAGWPPSFPRGTGGPFQRSKKNRTSGQESSWWSCGNFVAFFWRNVDWKGRLGRISAWIFVGSPLKNNGEQYWVSPADSCKGGLYKLNHNEISFQMVLPNLSSSKKNISTMPVRLLVNQLS